MKITNYKYHGGIVIEKGRREYWKVVNNKIRIWERGGTVEEMDGTQILKIGIRKSDEKKIVLLTLHGLREIECKNKGDRDLWLSTFETVRLLSSTNPEITTKDQKENEQTQSQKKELVEEQEIENNDLVNVVDEKLEEYCNKLLIDKENDEMMEIMKLIENEEIQTIGSENESGESIHEIVLKRKLQREEEMKRWKELEKRHQITNNDSAKESEGIKIEVMKNERVDDVLKKAIDLAFEIIGESDDLNQLRKEEKIEEIIDVKQEEVIEEPNVEQIGEIETKDVSGEEETKEIKIMNDTNVPETNETLGTNEKSQGSEESEKESVDTIQANNGNEEEPTKSKEESIQPDNEDIVLDFSVTEDEEEFIEKEIKQQPVEMSLTDFLGKESSTEEESRESEDGPQFQGLDFDEVMKQMEINEEIAKEEIKKDNPNNQEVKEEGSEEIEFEIESEENEIEVNEY